MKTDIWGKREMLTKVWWEELKKRDDLIDLGVDDSVILKYMDRMA
jgi:hypothetical protein